MSGTAGIAGAESPLPSVSGAMTRRLQPSARINGTSVTDEAGDACTIQSGLLPSPCPPER
jgi:hypothetical protein